MPAHDRVRLDDDEGRAPTPPQLGDPDPEDAVPLAEAGAWGRAADDGQLLAKSQILGDQRGTISQQYSKNAPDDKRQSHSRPRPSAESGIVADRRKSYRYRQKVIAKRKERV